MLTQGRRISIGWFQGRLKAMYQKLQRLKRSVKLCSVATTLSLKQIFLSHIVLYIFLGKCSICLEEHFTLARLNFI